MAVITLTKTNTKIYDTCLKAQYPSSNLGSEDSAFIGKSSGYIGRFQLFFDLGLIPNDAIINSAKLTVFRESTADVPAIEIYPLTASWVETGPSYNSPTTYDGLKKSTSTIVAATGYQDIDIAWIVQQFVNGSIVNNGILLKSSDEVTDNKIMPFKTKDNATYPLTITIDYTIPSTGKKQVEYVGAGSLVNGTNATSIQVPLPAQATEGDLLVAQIAFAGGGSPNALAGWQLFNANASGNVSVFYKFMVASEVSPTFTVSLSNLSARMVAFRNVKSIKQVQGQANFNGVTTCHPGAYTATIDKTLFALLNGAKGTGITFTQRSPSRHLPIISYYPKVTLNELHSFVISIELSRIALLS